MKNITSTAELKNAIQLLEAEQAIKEQLMKEQFHLTYESLKPVNIIIGTLKDIISSPNLMDNIFSNTIGLATGYLSKKIFVGTSGNIFRKLFGSILESGVSSFVIKHPEVIKSVGQFIFQHIFRKKEMNSQKP